MYNIMNKAVDNTRLQSNWIKRITRNKTIDIKDYNRREYFIPVASVVLDNETYKNGRKKRNTAIRFVPKLNTTDFKEKVEWLYLFTIDDRIVKIGGTRAGLQSRCASYLTGHHTRDRQKSGDCSKTNAFIYNTFEYYLQNGCTIEMFGYKLPRRTFSIKIFEQDRLLRAQTYHMYESVFIQDYTKVYGFRPILSDNCDPEYAT